MGWAESFGVGAWSSLFESMIFLSKLLYVQEVDIDIQIKIINVTSINPQS